MPYGSWDCRIVDQIWISHAVHQTLAALYNKVLYRLRYLTHLCLLLWTLG